MVHAMSMVRAWRSTESLYELNGLGPGNAVPWWQLYPGHYALQPCADFPRCRFIPGFWTIQRAPLKLYGTGVAHRNVWLR